MLTIDPKCNSLTITNESKRCTVKFRWKWKGKKCSLPKYLLLSNKKQVVGQMQKWQF